MRLFIVAIVMGFGTMGSSLLLLEASLLYNPSGIFAGMGLPPMEYGKIVRMIYFNVALSDLTCSRSSLARVAWDGRGVGVRPWPRKLVA